MILDEGTAQNLRKELKELNEKNGEENDAFAMNEIESNLRRKDWTELLEIRQQKNKFIVDL